MNFIYLNRGMKETIIADKDTTCTTQLRNCILVYILLFPSCEFSFLRKNTNQSNDQPPVGMLAQLVKALHLYRRCQCSHPSKHEFFQALFSKLYNLSLTNIIFFAFFFLDWYDKGAKNGLSHALIVSLKWKI